MHERRQKKKNMQNLGEKILTDLDPIHTLTKIIIFCSLDWSVFKQNHSAAIIHTNRIRICA